MDRYAASPTPLDKVSMPTLNWIGKDAVVNHHKEVPFHLLKCRQDLSVNAPQTSEVSETSEVSVEQFIQEAVSAARQKKPVAEQFFNACGKMARDPNAPPEIRALGAVLQHILAGEKAPDLSALPPELAALVRKALKE